MVDKTEEKKLGDLIQEAAVELRKRYDTLDAEVKKLGAPTAETKASVDAMNKRIDDLQAKMDAGVKAIAATEEKLGRITLVKPGAASPEMEAKKAEAKSAFYKFIRHGAEDLTSEERKQLVEDATGQYLIEPELDAEIQRELPKITVIRGLASVRTIGKDRLKMRSIGGVTVGWGKLETEDQDIEDVESTLTPGAPTFQYVEDLYGLAKIGEDELMDADVNLEGILAEEFSRALGEAEEAAFVIGRGHTTYIEPEGLTVNATLVGAAKETATADKVSVEDFLTIQYACPQQYRRNGSFLVNSATELLLRKLRAKGGDEEGDNEGPFLWQPAVAEGRPNTFIGKAIYCVDDMLTIADGAVVIAAFGDIRAGYRIVDRLGMTVQRLAELYAEDGLVGFKIHKRVTGNVMKAAQKPIVLLKNLASGS